MKRKFEDWYSQQLIYQLEGQDIELAEFHTNQLESTSPTYKELGAKWMVEMAEYFADNHRIIVNGFVRAGIAAALDGRETDDDENGMESDRETEDSDIESAFDDQ